MVDDDIEVQPKRPRRRWLALVRIIGSIALIAFLFQLVSFSEIVSAVANSGRRWPLLLGALILPAFGTLVAALRWQVLLRAQGFLISIRKLYEAILVGAFYNQILPSTIGGDVVRGWWVTDAERRPQGHVHGGLGLNLTVVALDRLTGLIGTCATACLASLMHPAVVSEIPGLWILLIVAAIAVIGFTLVLHFPTAGSGFAFLKRVSPRIEFVLQTLATYRGHKLRLYSACAYSIGLQSLIITQFYLLAVAFGSSITIWTLAVAVPIVTLISMVPVTINGIGLRENALAILGAPFGLSAALAVVVAWSVVFISLVFATIGGLIHLRGQHRREPLRVLWTSVDNA